jgi:hypothetical protein
MNYGVMVVGFLRNLGKLTGKVTGSVIGGTVKAVGEVTGSKFVSEVGEGVKKASEFAGDRLGQVTDGAWNAATGLLTDDKKKVGRGLHDITDSITQTAKGIVDTAKHTYQSGKELYEDAKDVVNEKNGEPVNSKATTEKSIAAAGSSEVNADEAGAKENVCDRAIETFEASSETDCCQTKRSSEQNIDRCK